MSTTARALVALRGFADLGLATSVIVHFARIVGLPLPPTVDGTLLVAAATAYALAVAAVLESHQLERFHTRVGPDSHAPPRWFRIARIVAAIYAGGWLLASDLRESAALSAIAIGLDFYAGTMLRQLISRRGSAGISRREAVR